MAVAVPDMDVPKVWAKKHGVANDSIDDLCRNQQLRDDVMKAFAAVAKNSRLYSYETVCIRPRIVL